MHIFILSLSHQPLVIALKIATGISWIILAGLVLSGPLIAAIVSGVFMTFNTFLLVYLERRRAREEEEHEEQREAQEREREDKVRQREQEREERIARWEYLIEHQKEPTTEHKSSDDKNT